MDDLISRNVAIDELRNMAVPLHKDPACEDIWERDRTLDNAIDKMREIPSIDAVPVVRCKDCKWYKKVYSWNGNERKICVMEPYEPVRKDYDFCSRGVNINEKI